ncbi:venom serine carboxypeptidase-like [Diorhabda sublineata]|uniref:venom serine carboxypeptidase-like n=1 Tax=Diorhabda sublineata TaxID=1163346 RepID=UPI0024E137D1|nr:venom serine carboxypeptidase-like [Diorhabda sublineata]
MTLKFLLVSFGLIILYSEAKLKQKFQAKRKLFQNVYGKIDGNIRDGDAGDPLILTDLINEGKIDEARHAAAVTSDIFLGIESYSGYLRVDDTYNSILFFWFVPSQSNAKLDPLVMWLQGGPGASSMYGLFNENGPFVIGENGSLILRETHWGETNSLLYFDQPAGTGFSKTNNGYAQNQTKVGDDLYTALIQFFKLFPNLRETDFFITGESYGGKYIPAIGHKIFRSNPTADLKINLKGIAIGNGWCVPEYQLRYSEYVHQHGLIDLSVKNAMNDMEEKAIQLIQQEEYGAALAVMEEDFGSLFSLFGQAASYIDPYNYLKVSLTDNEANLNNFLSREDVRRAIHVGNNEFTDDSNVYTNLEDDIPKSIANLLIDLINNYRVVLYNGQLDIVVAYPMMITYLQNLNFDAAEEYKNAERKVWYSDNNDIMGYTKTAGNLTEILVRNAGHMVPSDQPEVALKLINQLVRNIPFN